MARPRQRHGFVSARADHTIEAELQQAEELADDGRRAALCRGEATVLVAQEQEAAVVLQALGRELQRLLKERLRIETLQREIADAQQHLHAGLATVELFSEPRRQWRLAVPLGPIGAHALDQSLDFFDRERLRQV